jgi:2,4-dienoyl-CoA reductase-like NADH-dependent reductase (Old Yellow Enzyme family)
MRRVSDKPGFPLLLSPVTIGSFELRNRVVSTAHGAFLAFYRPGESGDRYIAYQERRARGGTGLIILQPLHVHHTSQAAGHYTYDAADLRPKLREMSRRLHGHGTRVLLQLLHFGAAFRSDSATNLEPLWSFSPFVSPTGSEAAHEMTAAEIEEVIAAYVAAATLAVECGLDGVEVQAAHGYLVQQSMSPWANQRTDEWGRRTRFAAAIIGRIRKAVGSEPLVGLRLTLDDWIRPEHGGIGPAGLREIARELAGTKQLDFFNVSAGARASHYSRSIGSYRHPPAPLLELTADLRASINESVPVIGVSRILTPEIAERALHSRACDLVGMTRSLIADPDLVAKLADRDRGPVRPCVGANQGCVDRQLGGLPITCFHNPEVGREHVLGALERSAVALRVLVVGGGPAGVKAAEIAALRGHQVTLAERSEQLGGRLRLAAECGARELLRSIDWVAGELDRHRVNLLLGTEVTPAFLAEQAFDSIVLATGSRPAPQRLPAGDESVTLLALEDALSHPKAGLDLLVVDQLGNEEVAMAAERLARVARSLTLITPMQTVAAHVGFTLVKDQLVRLYEEGCVLEPSTAFVAIEDGHVLTRHVHSGAKLRRRFDAVVAGVAGLPELGLREAALVAARQVLIAGDAVAPRSALHAFREGDAAGRAVG